MTDRRISRRSFLKLGVVALGGLALNRLGVPPPPFPFPQDETEYPTGLIGRVSHPKSISVYEAPDWNSAQVGYRFRDELLNIYYELTPTNGPAYNPLWYRVWGGYVHSGYIQRAKIRFNPPSAAVPKTGQLGEITVPYTQIYKNEFGSGWQPKNRLYYQSTHWVVGVDEGPDKSPWYRLYDELREEEYHIPAHHLRIIPDAEIVPLSPDVPWEQKWIEIGLTEQRLRAYEYGEVVLDVSVSTGVTSRTPVNGYPTTTPVGRFNVQSKMPSKHMGAGLLTNDPDVYTLPGVPWTMFFQTPPGYALHGAYWHNNYGLQMSHGCVNMRPAEAQWLFRWTDPKFRLPIKDRTDWEQRGYGTQVIIS